MLNDTRIAYGASCTWWDSIYRVGKIEKKYEAPLPCCPHCKSVLFEVPDERTWFIGVDNHEQDGHPGYRAMIEWARGKCFANLIDLEFAYNNRQNAV